MADPTIPGTYTPGSDAIYGANPSFWTPSQVEAQRAYAKALLQKSTEGPYVGKSGVTQAVSPWGVAGEMAQAGVGGFLQGQAGAREKQSILAPNISAVSGPIAGEPGYATSPMASSGTGSMSAYANGIASNESANQQHPQGNYTAIGPTTPSGDRAYGKYQVMGSNIGPWTQEVFGQPLSPQQFLMNPEVQDAVFQKKFGEYTQKYGPEGAARAWFAGEGNMNNLNATDGHETVGQYGQRFAQAAGINGQQAPYGGSPMAFNGQPQGDGGAAPNGQAAITMALRGGGINPPGPAAPNMAPPGRVGGGAPGQPIPQGFFTQRQPVSRDQFVQIMSNPYANPELKQYIANAYYSQFQPVSMQGPYGNTYIQSAQGQQMVVPPAPHWTETQAGDVHVQRPQVINPTGQVQTLGGGGGPVQAQTQGAGSNIAPSNTFSIGGGQGDISAGRAASPPNPNAATGPRSEATPQQPVRTAMAETGTASDAGPLAYAPPDVNAKPAPVPPAPGTQTAQNFTDMTDEQLANYAQERALGAEFGKKDIEEYSDKYKNYQTSASTAVQGLPQIEAARNMIEDPRMIQGPWADAKQSINNAFTALSGNDRTTAATTLRDAFDKIRSSSILVNMRETLQGLGQVRLAEINLLGQANASAGNTLGANRAILTLAQRSAQQMADIGQITNAYRSGVRWDNKGNVVATNAADRPTMAGQEAAVKTYLMSHPLLSKDEISQFSKFLSLPEDKAKPAATLGAILPKGATYHPVGQ